MEKIDKSYLMRVLKNLYLQDSLKKEIAFELKSTIDEAQEKKTLKEVLKDLGSPEEIAHEFMENYANTYENMGFINALLYSFRVKNFQIQSQKKLWNLPLISIATGFNPKTGKPHVAKGIIAFGSIAEGLLAIGGIAVGFLALGGVAAGGLALGGITFGLLGLGGLVLALLLGLGGITFAGHLSLGGLAISRKYAAGGLAHAPHAYSGHSTAADLPSWMIWLVEPQRFALILGLAVGLILFLILGFLLVLYLFRLKDRKNLNQIIREINRYQY